MSPVAADQTCTMVRRNFGSFLSTKLFQFSNFLGMSGVIHPLEVMHLNQVEVRPDWVVVPDASPALRRPQTAAPTPPHSTAASTLRARGGVYTDSTGFLHGVLS